MKIHLQAADRLRRKHVAKPSVVPTRVHPVLLRVRILRERHDFSSPNLARQGVLRQASVDVMSGLGVIKHNRSSRLVLICYSLLFCMRYTFDSFRAAPPPTIGDKLLVVRCAFFFTWLTSRPRVARGNSPVKLRRVQSRRTINKRSVTTDSRVSERRVLFQDIC